VVGRSAHTEAGPRTEASDDGGGSVDDDGDEDDDDGDVDIDWGEYLRSPEEVAYVRTLMAAGTGE
jgi:hypothetical protein